MSWYTKFILRLIIFSIVLIIVDLFFYRAVKGSVKNLDIIKQKLIVYFYWGYTAFSIIAFILSTSYISSHLGWPRWARMYLFSFLVVVLISKLAGSFILFINDFINLLKWVKKRFQKKTLSFSSTTSISRSQFLNYMALGIASIPFAGMISAMIEAFHYKIHNIKIVLPNLPAAFNGLKIVQISDIHAGSFASTLPLEKAVKIILEQNADIIFFTGDLVNSRTNEIIPFMETLSKIKAPMGVFSILGNHDYGNYSKWKNKKDRIRNLQQIIDAHEQLGWKLLMDEHIALKKEDSEIALIGVENWGARMRHPKYGNLKRACMGTEKYPVKILLSHDPSHWDIQVITQYKDIDLTLSGHTHGFQCGVEIPGFQWSPAQYVYKHWAGLYTEGQQQLYVNRGLGFLGFPGRIGILPEITVMELSNA